MRSLIYISFILFCLVSCSKAKEDTREQNIVKAEQIQDNPSEIISLLEGISLDNLDNNLSVRLCLTFGKAANKLNRNDLLSIINLTKVLKYCELPQEKAWINYLLGIAYFEQKNYYRTLDLYKEALTFADEYNDIDLKGKINFSMGTVYIYQDMLEESKSMYKLAAEAYKESGNLEREISSMARVAYCLTCMDSVQTALRYALETEKYVEKSNDIAKSYSANTSAFVYSALGKYELAEKYALKSIALDSINTASNYLQLASIYTKQKKYKKAHETLDIAETSNYTNKHVPMTTALFRSEVYKAEGNMKAYEKYRDKYENFYIPLSANKMAKLEKELNTNKAEISNLTKEKNFYISNFGFGFIVFFIVLIFMFVIMRSQKRREQKSYEQIKNMLNNDVFSKMDEINKNISKINELSK